LAKKRVWAATICVSSVARPASSATPPRAVELPERAGDDHQHDDRDEEPEVVDVLRQRRRDARPADAADERLETLEERQVEQIGRRAGRQRADPGEEERTEDRGGEMANGRGGEEPWRRFFATAQRVEEARAGHQEVGRDIPGVGAEERAERQGEHRQPRQQ
jgi:hypothetical protein